ncbi:hypothetical protein [Rhizobium halophilum]|uniref:hypothetical protein n=1 Tax=Rhizobium halophilum TaxID=2846852 RepID=UPI001EFCB758|nr:hypothetical protein [Rhizobium halophilum]MCF6370966.1 hypothetical protein [Rhizobium halophilum]
MSSTQNEESSVARSPNFPTPLSVNPNSNEAEGGSMNTTVTTPAAMLTEQELWEQFSQMTIERRDNLSFEAKSYRVIDLVEDCGFNGFISDFSQHVAADIANSDNPSSELDCWIDDLECWLTSLKQVSHDFERLRAAHQFTPEEPDGSADDETYAKWEQAANEADTNPRYRSPSTPLVGILLEEIASLRARVAEYEAVPGETA